MESQPSASPARVDWSGTSAVLGTDGAPAVPRHFGQPLQEQRALLSGAVVDASHRGVITVGGPDRLSWLNSLTTQHLLGLEPGRSTETLVLSPHGHIEHWFHLIDDGETSWLISLRDPAPAAAFLDSMRFMLRVEVADRSEEFAIVLSTAALADAWQPVIAWQDPWPQIAPGGADGSAVAPEDHPGRGFSWIESIVPLARLQAAARGELDAAGRDESAVAFAGLDAAEALRLEAWRPGALEADHRTLVAEIDLLRTGVHLAKGCYRGQEAVARVHNLGQPPRRLVFLHLDGSAHELPEPGAEVLGRVRGVERGIGHITSAAVHHELGPIALAVIKRSVEIDEVLAIALPSGEKVSGAQDEVVPRERARAVTLPPRNRELFRRP